MFGIDTSKEATAARTAQARARQALVVAHLRQRGLGWVRPSLTAWLLLGFFGLLVSPVSGIVLVGPLATFWWVGLLLGSIVGGISAKLSQAAAGPVPGMTRLLVFLINVVPFALFTHFAVVQTIPLASFLLGSKTEYVFRQVIGYNDGGYRQGCEGFLIGSAPIGARRACGLRRGTPSFDLRSKTDRRRFAERRPLLCVSGLATPLAIRPTEVVATGRQLFAGDSPCGKYLSARW